MVAQQLKKKSQKKKPKKSQTKSQTKNHKKTKKKPTKNTQKWCPVASVLLTWEIPTTPPRRRPSCASHSGASTSDRGGSTRTVDTRKPRAPTVGPPSNIRPGHVCPPNPGAGEMPHKFLTGISRGARLQEFSTWLARAALWWCRNGFFIAWPRLIVHTVLYYWIIYLEIRNVLATLGNLQWTKFKSTVCSFVLHIFYFFVDM